MGLIKPLTDEDVKTKLKWTRGMKRWEKNLESVSRLSVLRQVVDLMNQPCPHHDMNGRSMALFLRHECQKCWRDLESEIAELEAKK